MSNKLSDSRVFITGGAGLVGSHICDLLIREDIKEITVYDNFTRGSERNIENVLNSGKVKVVKGDIKDRDELRDAMKGSDFCFHMAAIRITQCAQDPAEAFDTMFMGTFNVLQACKDNNVKKIVAASSASIYGMAEEFPTNEKHHPYNNRTLYGASKISNELMLRSFYDMYGLDYVALRFFNVYGPRMDTYGKYTEVLIRWYHLIKKQERPKIFGDGKQTMDFVYIEDIARACVTAMGSDVTDEVFNVARGEETSLDELCKKLIKAMKAEMEPEYLPLPEERKRGVEVLRRLADTSKAENMLGFQAEVGLEDGLSRLVHWLDSL